jgi:pimeloyl-ACP methyl ester carboxylesterase
MLIPGLGLDHNYYRFGEPLLRERCKTILVDPRGLGASRKDSPGAVHYTPQLWADDFAARSSIRATWKFPAADTSHSSRSRGKRRTRFSNSSPH